MKTRVFTMMTALALVTLAGCDKSEKEEPWNGEIRLSSGLEVQQLGRSSSQSLQGGGVDRNNKLGLFINEENPSVAPTTTYVQNMECTANPYGAINTSPTQYYPFNGGGVYLIAYAPYNSGYSDGKDGKMSFSVQADQTSDAGYIASDLLWGQPMKETSAGSGSYVTANPVARTKEKVNISFAHLLSKVDVLLREGSGITENDLKGATVSILQALPSTTLDMTNGSISAASGTKTDIKMVTIPENGTLTGSAVVVPQTFAAGTDFLLVELANGAKLYYTLPEDNDAVTEGSQDLVLKGGMRYSYTITVNLTMMDVTASIALWESIGKNPVYGSAEMK